MRLVHINKDLLRHIVQFLDNQTIIHLLVVSRDVHSLLADHDPFHSYNNYIQRHMFSCHYKNLFTSITIYPTDDLMKAIRRYLDHKQTIQKTTLYVKEPDLLWPFTSKEMVYIKCR
jgi:hypothetical protein